MLKESKSGLKPGMVFLLQLFHVSGPCATYPTAIEVARWLFTFWLHSVVNLTSYKRLVLTTREHKALSFLS